RRTRQHSRAPRTSVRQRSTALDIGYSRRRISRRHRHPLSRRSRRMTLLRALVVDDERLGRQKIATMLSAHDDFEIVGECANGVEAAAEIRRKKPDLVFLDIEMPGSDA